MRHGLYDEDDPLPSEIGKALTPAGHEQASAIALRLAALPVKFDVVYSSKMTRARETTAAIVAALGGLKPSFDDDIRECTLLADGVPAATAAEDVAAAAYRRTIARAFERYFQPSPDRDRTELIVTHGNVIRTLVSMSLGIDPAHAGRLGIANASLTVIRIAADRSMQLVAYNDVGHLPVTLQTLSAAHSYWPHSTSSR